MPTATRPAITPTAGTATTPTALPAVTPTVGTATTPTATVPVNTQPPITFVADADARVDAAAPDANFGKWDTLRVDNGPGPQIQSYLHFTVQNISSSVVSATLRIYVTSQSTSGAAISATSPNWSENNLTWNNRPQPTTAAFGKAVAVHANTWVNYDITPLIKGNGSVSLALIARSMDGMNFTSRETNTKPQLLVTVRKP